MPNDHFTKPMKLTELTTREEKEEAFALMQEFIPLLTRQDFVRAFESDFFQNHKLFGLRDSGRLVTVAAVWLLMTGLMEKLIWVSAIVTDKSERSKGYGKALVEGLEEHSKKEGIDEIWAHTNNERAQQFWEQTAGFKEIARVLRKKIQK